LWPNNAFQPTRCASLALQDRWYFDTITDLLMLYSRSGRLNASRWAVARNGSGKRVRMATLDGITAPSAIICYNHRRHTVVLPSQNLRGAPLQTGGFLLCQ